MRSRCRACHRDGLRHFGPVKDADNNIQKYVSCEFCGAEHRKSGILTSVNDLDAPGSIDGEVYFWLKVVLTIGIYYLLDLIWRKFVKLLAFMFYGRLDTPYVLVRRWWR